MQLTRSSIYCRHTIGSILPLVAFARNEQTSKGWDFVAPEELD